MKVYAYFRVSTGKQETDRQKYLIQKFCKEKNIKIDEWYEDTISGKINNSKRKGYFEMKEKLQKGDLLIVTEVDRIGRDYYDTEDEYRWFLKNEVNLIITKFETLNIDFNAPQEELTTTFIKDLLIKTFCYSAQIEREKISERTKEALAAKKMEGIQLGRPVDVEKVELVIRLRAEGKTQAEIGKSLGITRQAVGRMLKRHKNKLENLE